MDALRLSYGKWLHDLLRDSELSNRFLIMLGKANHRPLLGPQPGLEPVEARAPEVVLLPHYSEQSLAAISQSG
jgi:hypothetical protein